MKIQIPNYSKALLDLTSQKTIQSNPRFFPRIANVVTTVKLLPETNIRKQNRQFRRNKIQSAKKKKDTLQDFNLDKISLVRAMPGKLDPNNFAALVVRMIDKTTELIFKSGNIVTINAHSIGHGIWTCRVYAYLISKIPQMFLPEDTDFSNWTLGCGKMPATPIMTTLEGRLCFNDCWVCLFFFCFFFYILLIFFIAGKYCWSRSLGIQD